MNDLPVPEVVHCSFDDGFPAQVAVMGLRWPEVPGAAHLRFWHFPGEVRLLSPLPERFGIRVLRHGIDAYCLFLSWDGLCLRWASLTRAQIMAGSLQPLLHALATDIRSLLDQPILADVEPLAKSA